MVHAEIQNNFIVSKNKTLKYFVFTKTKRFINPLEYFILYSLLLQKGFEMLLLIKVPKDLIQSHKRNCLVYFN